MIHILYKNFSSTRKFIHFPFQLCDNSIWMPIIISVSFSRKSKILSVVLYNPQFYHEYFRWTSSVLSENISTSLFNCLLIVFVCRSLYLSVFTNKSSILSIISCNPQFSHTYVRWRSSVLYINVSSSFFNNTVVVFVCLSCIWGFFQYIFNFINYLMLSWI